MIAAQPAHGANATDTLSYSGADRAAQIAAPVTVAPAAPAASATTRAASTPKTKEAGIFWKDRKVFPGRSSGRSEKSRESGTGKRKRRQVAQAMDDPARFIGHSASCSLPRSMARMTAWALLMDS